MKLMIVDDETLVRVGLKTTIQSMYEDIRFLEASDGQQALYVFAQEKPNLVFVDINMPVLDGLGFIVEARRLGYPCKFVILTCIEDLSVVRKAIKLGISDYIVKTSINSGELMDLIDRARQELAEKGNSHNNEYIDFEVYGAKLPAAENVIRNLIQCPDWENELFEQLIERYGLHFLKGRFSLLVVYSSKLYKIAADASEDSKTRYEKLQVSMINLINDMLSDYYGGICLKLGEQELVIILPFGKHEEEERKSFVEEFCSRVIKSTKLYLNLDVSIGIYLQASARRLGASCEFAKSALVRRFYDNHPAYYIYGKEEGKPVPIELLRGCREKAEQWLEEMDYDRCLKLLSSLREMLLEYKGENINEIYDCYVQLFYRIVAHIEKHYPEQRDNLLEGLDYRAFIKCDTVFELECIFGEIISNLKAVSELNREGYHLKLVKRVQMYVLNNIHEQVDLTKAAKYVNISPGYLSELFKQVTGEKFMNFLTRAKVEKAAEYIKQGQKPSTVFEKIGYDNYSYFCRVFKKVTGMGVSEYCRRYAKNNM